MSSALWEWNFFSALSHAEEVRPSFALFPLCPALLMMLVTKLRVKDVRLLEDGSASATAHPNPIAKSGGPSVRGSSRLVVFEDEKSQIPRRQEIIGTINRPKLEVNVDPSVTVAFDFPLFLPTILFR